LPEIYPIVGTQCNVDFEYSQSVLYRLQRYTWPGSLFTFG